MKRCQPVHATILWFHWPHPGVLSGQEEDSEAPGALAHLSESKLHVTYITKTCKLLRLKLPVADCSLLKVSKLLYVIVIGEAQAGKCPCSLESLWGASSRDVFLITSSRDPWADADRKKEVRKNRGLSRLSRLDESNCLCSNLSCSFTPNRLLRSLIALDVRRMPCLQRRGAQKIGSLTERCHWQILFFHFFQAWWCFQVAISCAAGIETSMAECSM